MPSLPAPTLTFSWPIYALLFCHTHPKEGGKNKSPKKRSIESKESARWLESLERSLEGIPGHVTVVTVCDREADIYEFIRKALLEEKPSLMRVTYNRPVLKEQRGIFALVESCPESGKILVDIPRHTRHRLPARQATLVVKYLLATMWPTLEKAKMTVD